MKKVIFEGVVNGVKFDNVEDYNKAITKAVARGEEVHASTQTKMVDEPEKSEVDYTKRANILFPGLGTSDVLTEQMFTDVDKIYKEICDMDEDDMSALVADTVYEELCDMDEDELGMYEEDLGKICGFISDYQTETSNKIGATTQMIDNITQRYQAQLKKLTSDKQNLEDALHVANKLNLYYTESAKMLDEVRHEDDKEEDERPEPVNLDREQAIAKLLNLCESIFPDYKKHFDSNK